MQDTFFIDVAGVDEMPEKGFIVRPAGDVGVVLCKAGDELYAVENRCSHAFQSFVGGRLRGTRLACPMHGACFDIRDGKALSLPATRPIRTFPLKIDGGRILVAVEDAVIRR